MEKSYKNLNSTILKKNPIQTQLERMKRKICKPRRDAREMKGNNRRWHAGDAKADVKPASSVDPVYLATPCISVAGERTIQRNRERCYTIISMPFPWAPLRFVSPARSPASPVFKPGSPTLCILQNENFASASRKETIETPRFHPVPCTRQKHYPTRQLIN